MGYSKALLPFGPETMLQRVVNVVGPVVATTVVVAAARQALPPLPASVVVVRDEKPERGPLEGLLAGLRALPEAAAGFVTSCDVPLLTPQLPERLFSLLGQADAAVPWIEGFWQPLTAVYRARVAVTIAELLASGCRRPTELFPQIVTRRIEADELQTVDPLLQSFRNLNRPDDYLAALAECGFQPTAEVLSRILGESG